MRKFARLIARGKWPEKDELNKYIDNIEELSARTIVQDLAIKGSDSALSIWELDDEKKLVLSLVNGSKTSISKMFFLTIDEELLNKFGLHLSHIEGDSVVEDLNDKHYDIVDLKYKDLGKVAKVIMESLKDEDINLRRISQKKVEIIIKTAVENGEIDKMSLHEDLRKKLFGEDERSET